MARRKRGTPEQQARRALISELLSAANVQSMDDIQNLFKETIAEFMEGSLESELDEEFGYEPYDVKNKVTDNSRNGHSKKTLKTSMGSVEVDIPRDRNGEFEPQLLKKNQTSISPDMENKITTTNAIEGFNRQLRKATKTRSVFPTDDSLFKLLYLAMNDITKKWTGRRQEWSRIYAQLVIYYGDRLPE